MTSSLAMGDDAGLSNDAFLGGKLHLWQPRAGYRAGVDPVLLAASVPAKPGQSVLDVGCGAGAAMFCLGARVSPLDLYGLEVQPEYADLARRNADQNAIRALIVGGDVANMPVCLKERQFDHVITNPPYYRDGDATRALNADRARALSETVSLDVWLKACAKRIAPGGMLTVIQRADRVVDVLKACPDGLGRILLQPIAARAGREASLVIVQATLGAQTAPRILAPIIMHDGLEHSDGPKDYSAVIEATLRDGAALPMGARNAI